MVFDRGYQRRRTWEDETEHREECGVVSAMDHFTS
jgi:hypothetical protein